MSLNYVERQTDGSYCSDCLDDLIERSGPIMERIIPLAPDGDGLPVTQDELMDMLRGNPVIRGAGRRVLTLGDGPFRVVERGGPGSGHFGHEGRPGEVGGSAPSSGAAGSAKEAQSAYRADIPADILARSFYHGTSSEATAKAIMASGEIEPFMTHKAQGKMAPVEGRAYVAQDPEYALIYALGANMAGHDMPQSFLDGEGRYGYIFEVDSRSLDDIQPDEDAIGEAIHDHKYGWLDRLAASRLTREQLRSVEDGEYADWAASGKKLVQYMSPDQKFQMIRDGAHVANQGAMDIIRAWRIDKTQSADYFRRDYDIEETPAEHQRRVDRIWEISEPVDLSLTERGGPGSGHFGHEGRPGEVGGSAPSSGGSAPSGATLPRSMDLTEAQRRKLGEDGILLHAASTDFPKFDISKTPHGAIYFSDPSIRPTSPTQAEYIGRGPFGGRLIFATLDRDRLKWFDPRNDESARKIFADLFPGRGTMDDSGGIFDMLHYVLIPELVKSEAYKRGGYNAIRVYEPAVQGQSIAVTDDSLLRILGDTRDTAGPPPWDLLFTERGGPGSGHFGHEGRPGKVGGSQQSGKSKIRIDKRDYKVRSSRTLRQWMDYLRREWPVFDITKVKGWGTSLIILPDGEIIEPDAHGAAVYDLGQAVGERLKMRDLLANGFVRAVYNTPTANKRPAVISVEFSAKALTGPARDALRSLYWSASAASRRAGMGDTAKVTGDVYGEHGNLQSLWTISSFEGAAGFRIDRGGPGSGHFGHEGRPGKVGGSLPGGAASTEPDDEGEWSPVKGAVAYDAEDDRLVRIIKDNGDGTVDVETLSGHDRWSTYRGVVMDALEEPDEGEAELWTSDHPKQILNRAVALFGTTWNPVEAGYILPNGDLLDLSGKNQGGKPGYRSLDHRDVGVVLGIDDPGGTEGMREFMRRTGAVRMSLSSDGEALSVNFATKLRAAQRAAISDIIATSSGLVWDVTRYDPETESTTVVSTGEGPADPRTRDEMLIEVEQLAAPRPAETAIWHGYTERGGPGSGHFGHEGRPGKVGGSQSSGAASPAPRAAVREDEGEYAATADPGVSLKDAYPPINRASENIRKVLTDEEIRLFHKGMTWDNAAIEGAFRPEQLERFREAWIGNNGTIFALGSATASHELAAKAAVAFMKANTPDGDPNDPKYARLLDEQAEVLANELGWLRVSGNAQSAALSFHEDAPPSDEQLSAAMQLISKVRRAELDVFAWEAVTTFHEPDGSAVVPPRDVHRRIRGGGALTLYDYLDGKSPAKARSFLGMIRRFWRMAFAVRGGPGSGHFGHEGRPGKVGGSQSSGAANSAPRAGVHEGEGGYAAADESDSSPPPGTNPEQHKVIDGINVWGGKYNAEGMWAVFVDNKMASTWMETPEEAANDYKASQKSAEVDQQRERENAERRERILAQISEGEITDDLIGDFARGRRYVTTTDAVELYRDLGLSKKDATRQAHKLGIEAESRGGAVLRDPMEVLARAIYIATGDVPAEYRVERGGPGSGNFDHAGRPGEVGGSKPKTGGSRPLRESDADGIWRLDFDSDGDLLRAQAFAPANDGSQDWRSFRQATIRQARRGKPWRLELAYGRTALRVDRRERHDSVDAAKAAGETYLGDWAIDRRQPGSVTDRHYGPGPHPGTGTPQTIHGGHGAGDSVTRTGVTMFHGTARAFVDSILSTGLKRGLRWLGRDPSVYFTDSMDAAKQYGEMLHSDEEGALRGAFAVIEFRIPESVLEQAKEDDLDSSKLRHILRGATPYRLERDIPADWIRKAIVFRKPEDGLPDEYEVIEEMVAKGRGRIMYAVAFLVVPDESSNEPFESRHYGPGPHPGTGTPQDVHAESAGAYDGWPSEAAIEAENQIVSGPYETAVVFDRDNRKWHQTDMNERGIDIDDEAQKQLIRDDEAGIDIMMMHNHPNDAPFSDPDVLFAVEHGIDRMVVVSPERRFVMDIRQSVPDDVFFGPVEEEGARYGGVFFEATNRASIAYSDAILNLPQGASVEVKQKAYNDAMSDAWRWMADQQPDYFDYFEEER